MKTHAQPHSSEHLEQSALFDWARFSENTIPELAMLFAVPNGGMRPMKRAKNGSYYSPVAVKLKAEGVRRGVPDVFLEVARGKYHGLRLEMKYGKNKCSPEQKDWIERLLNQGYLVKVPYSFEEARDIILMYLALAPGDEFEWPFQP